MIDQLHVLSFSRGSWDDYRWIKVGVFSSEENAKAVADKFLAKVKELKETVDSECPMSAEDRNRYEENCDFDFFESLPVEQQDEYHLWEYRKNEIMDINDEYQIVKFDLDKHDLSDFEQISID